MKRHPIDYFSLIAGFGFGAIAIATLADRPWFGLDTWNGRWIGPIILIALGLIVIAPKRSSLPAETNGMQTPPVGQDLDTISAAHDELPQVFMQDDLPTDEN